jgi:hypothetical protein
VHPRPRFEQVDADQSDDQCNGGQHLEVKQRLETDAADAFEALHAGDAADHGAENDRRDEHLDQLDEGVTQGFHLFAQRRAEMPENDAQHNRGQHLNVQMLIKRLALRGAESCGVD